MVKKKCICCVSPCKRHGFIEAGVPRRASITSITRPPSSLTEGRRYVTDGVRLAQRPRRGASRRLR
jgi:hypothetical protein